MHTITASSWSILLELLIMIFVGDAGPAIALSCG
jgi:hypothetical protein